MLGGCDSGEHLNLSLILTVSSFSYDDAGRVVEEQSNAKYQTLAEWFLTICWPLAKVAFFLLSSG